MSEKYVLSCIDGSSVGDAVCDYACWISKLISKPLNFLHTIEHRHNLAFAEYSGTIGTKGRKDIIEKMASVEQELRTNLIEQGQELLASAKERASKSGVLSPELTQRHGTLLESLIDLEEHIRVLVIGIRGESHDRRREGVGTQLESIIRGIHRPIFVVNKEFSEPKKAMLAYDGSDCCHKALDWIVANKAFHHMPCHVVHVGDTGAHLLEEAGRKLKAAGVEVVTKNLKGKTDETLAAYQLSENIDVTLMGAFSHTRIRGLLLGSFTAKMLSKTNKPLLLLR